MGSIAKVLSVEVENVPWRFCPFFTFGIVGWRVGRIAADFYPQLLKNRFLQPVCLLRIVTQLVEMLARLLPCSGVADKLPLSRSFYAGPAKWRENNGAKMTSRPRKKFPMRVNETKQVKITLACFKSLTDADLSLKDEFDQLFNFQGPVISECTIVHASSVNTWPAAKDQTVSPDHKWPQLSASFNSTAPIPKRSPPIFPLPLHPNLDLPSKRSARAESEAASAFQNWSLQVLT